MKESNVSYPHKALDRRSFLRGAAALGAGALAAGAGFRPAAAASDAAPTRSVGCFDVIALRDAAGPFFLPYDVAFSGASEQDWAAARRIDPAAFGEDMTWNLDFRCYAVRRPGGRYSLVDTGVGPAGSPASAWAPVPGVLPQALADNGIDVADVDTVVLTHLHEDHTGWSVTAEGAPMFPNARYVVQQRELDALEAEGSALLAYAVEPLRAAGQLHPVDGAVVLTGDGAARRAGDRISVVPTPGHTPGHQSVLVEGGRDEQLVVTGDVLVHAVQLADPDVAYRYESDQQVARLTRRALLEAAERDRAVLATAHLNRPFVRLR